MRDRTASTIDKTMMVLSAIILSMLATPSAIAEDATTQARAHMKVGIVITGRQTASMGPQTAASSKAAIPRDRTATVSASH